MYEEWLGLVVGGREKRGFLLPPGPLRVMDILSVPGVWREVGGSLVWAGEWFLVLVLGWDHIFYNPSLSGYLYIARIENVMLPP